MFCRIATNGLYRIRCFVEIRYEKYDSIVNYLTAWVGSQPCESPVPPVVNPKLLVSFRQLCISQKPGDIVTMGKHYGLDQNQRVDGKKDGKKRQEHWRLVSRKCILQECRELARFRSKRLRIISPSPGSSG